MISLWVHHHKHTIEPFTSIAYIKSNITFFFVFDKRNPQKYGQNKTYKLGMSKRTRSESFEFTWFTLKLHEPKKRANLVIQSTTRLADLQTEIKDKAALKANNLKSWIIASPYLPWRNGIHLNAPRNYIKSWMPWSSQT